MSYIKLVWKLKERSVSSLVCLFQEVNNMLELKQKGYINLKIEEF